MTSKNIVRFSIKFGGTNPGHLITEEKRYSISLGLFKAIDKQFGEPIVVVTDKARYIDASFRTLQVDHLYIPNEIEVLMKLKIQ